MTTQEYKEFEDKAINGTMPDALNPIFIFSLTATDLLKQIASGEIDIKALAEIELSKRR